MPVPRSRYKPRREPVLGDGVYTTTVYFVANDPGKFLDDIRHFARRFVSSSRVNALVPGSHPDLQEIWQHLSHRHRTHTPQLPGATGRVPTPALNETRIGDKPQSGDAVQIRIGFVFGWMATGAPYVREVYFSMQDTEENIRSAQDDAFCERAHLRALERERNRQPTEQEFFMPDLEWAYFSRDYFIGPGPHGKGGVGYDTLQRLLQAIYPLAREAASRHKNHFLPGGSSEAQQMKAGAMATKTLSKTALSIGTDIIKEKGGGTVGKFFASGGGKTAVKYLPTAEIVLNIVKGNYWGAGGNAVSMAATFAFEGNPATGLITSIAGMFEEFIYLGESNKVMTARRKIYSVYALGIINRFTTHKTYPTDPVAAAIAEAGYTLADALSVAQQVALQLLLLYRASRDSGWSFASNPQWRFPDDYKRNWCRETLLHGLLNSFGDEPFCTK